MDITAQDYNADKLDDVPTLSVSIANLLLNYSPRHAWLAHPRLNPDYKDQEPSSQMELGTAMHALLLEGRDIVQVCFYDDWRTKDARAERDEARQAGRVPLLEKQYKELNEMILKAKNAFSDCVDLDGYKLSKGESEQTILWEDGGVLIRNRLDWISEDRTLILDYKTTEISTPAAWARSIVSNGYDVQAAAYTKAVKKKFGTEPKFVFMVQETKYPYFCYFVGMPPIYMDMGEKKWSIARDMWKKCLERDEWPGYTNRIMYPEPPNWAIADVEERQLNHDSWSKEAFLFGSVKNV